jgi:hypothetical protein
VPREEAVVDGRGLEARRREGLLGAGPALDGTVASMTKSWRRRRQLRSGRMTASVVVQARL